MLWFEWYEAVVGALIVILAVFLRKKLPPAATSHSGNALNNSDIYFSAGVFLVAGAVYYVANNYNSGHDYTFRIAKALLRGQLGLDYQPPAGLNEFIPYKGYFFSAFPLGSVLCMLPAAALLAAYPAKLIVGLLGGGLAVLGYLLARAYRIGEKEAVFYSSFLTFGTWHLCNMAFGGAWQVAIGFAVVALLAAIYFTVVFPKPLLAGIFFAVAFGNRTELLLAAPFFLYFFYRPRYWRLIYKDFLLVPFFLLVLTALYNFKRFGSPFDFGYMRIPGVLQEPWYRQGLFNFQAIFLNLRQMLLVGWKRIPVFPFFRPTGFGGSIFIASPFLFTIFRQGIKNPRVFWGSWATIVPLVAVLWLHGNPGGWQYSYRYAAILLPFIYLLILEKSPEIPGRFEKVAVPASIFLSVLATILFYWTKLMTP